MTFSSILRLAIILIVVVQPVFAIDFIVNTHVPDQKYTLEKLHDIFLGTKKTWSDNTPIHTYILPAHSLVTAEFTKLLFNVTPEGYFAKIVLISSKYPIVLFTEYAMLVRVALDPNAIGYVYNNDMVDKFKSIKVLSLEP